MEPLLSQDPHLVLSRGDVFFPRCACLAMESLAILWKLMNFSTTCKFHSINTTLKWMTIPHIPGNPKNTVEGEGDVKGLKLIFLPEKFSLDKYREEILSNREPHHRNLLWFGNALKFRFCCSSLNISYYTSLNTFNSTYFCAHKLEILFQHQRDKFCD